MDVVSVSRARRLVGRPSIPGDKSISHRALLLGALAEGVSAVHGLAGGADVASTTSCLAALGVVITREGPVTRIHGAGRRGLAPPDTPLDCGNSGTTMRALLGLLAGAPGEVTLTGDASLLRRPMERVAAPLRLMGADITLAPGGRAPARVVGMPLRAIAWELPLPSAQVKTALLLAALAAEGVTTLGGRLDSRDHTERLLPLFGAHLRREPGALRLEGGARLHPAELRIPGDLSAAAFWIAAAAMIPGARVELEGVGLNPTRTGLVEALRQMGASVRAQIQQEQPEVVGGLEVQPGELRAVEISPEQVPALIDELPVLAVVATQARGTTRVRGAGELRHKESDRIAAMVQGLRAMGAQIEALPDGFVVEGPCALRGAPVRSHGDHRIAMALAVAGLVADGVTPIEGASCVAVSDPSFFQTLHELTGS